MAQGVEVKGLRQVVRSLERMGAEVADLKAVFVRVGAIVTDRAETLAPRLRGTLAGSIRASKSKNKALIRVGGAGVPYAGVIHYGGYHNITAQPFLTDAIDDSRAEVVDEFEQGLNNLIRKLDLN